MTMMTSNYDEPPPFDEDELINEYNEEYFDPVSQYDDAMEQMIEDHVETKPNNETSAQNGVTAAVVESRQSDELNAVGENVTKPMEIDNEEVEGDGVVELKVPREVTVDKITHRQKELYSFERYSGKREWRLSEKSQWMKREEEETMAVTNWKRRLTESMIKKKEQNNKKSKKRRGNSNTSPEAQLVRFLNHNELGGQLNEDSFRFIAPSYSNNIPKEGHASIPVTTFNGEMLWIHKHPKEVFNSTSKQVILSKSMRKDVGLLQVPMKELVRRAEVIERRTERRKKFKSSVDEDNKTDAEEAPIRLKSDSEGGNKSWGNEVQVGQLWVDKHAPTDFTDLLSDERSNREVLRALREWDQFVFQKKPPSRPKYYEKKMEEANEKTSGQKKIDGEKVTTNDVRPDEKSRVILLSGPPGVGKTTLAHILSRHAGYRAVEVNASDERSASVLKDRVIRAMESTTLSAEHFSGKADTMFGRPNCLILDEIDGADAKSSIMTLVNIIREEMPAKGTKRQHKKPYLRRPIIFICNHKYAPALRPLLPYARQFDILPPSSNRLVSRLKTVLTSENITVTSGNEILNKLVLGTGGDIRACLYTLQFASARAREVNWKKQKLEASGESLQKLVDISQVLSRTLGGKGSGIKDERTDLLNMLSIIFRKLKVRQSAGKFQRKRVNDVERVLSAVQAFGDSSKTLDTLFNNIMNVSFVDPTLDRTWSAHEWLSGADIYRSSKSTLASYSVVDQIQMQRSYIPSTAAAIHFLCRMETRPNVTASTRSMTDAVYLSEAKTGLVDKFLDGLSPSIRVCNRGSGVITELLPYCLWLLSAGQGNGALSRGVSSVEVLSEYEKKSFNVHVKLLRTLGLTYVIGDNDQEDKDNYNKQNIEMRLEPEIDKVVQFEGLSGTTQRRIIPSVLKELLAHAANVEKLRESEKRVNSNQENMPEQVQAKEYKPIVKDKKENNASISEKKENIQRDFLGIGAIKAKAAKTAWHAAKVGFHLTKGKVKVSNTGSGVPLDQVIRFKYQKGFTQAIRHTCSKDDIILW